MLERRRGKERREKRSTDDRDRRESSTSTLSGTRRACIGVVQGINMVDPVSSGSIEWS